MDRYKVLFVVTSLLRGRIRGNSWRVMEHYRRVLAFILMAVIVLFPQGAPPLAYAHAADGDIMENATHQHNGDHQRAPAEHLADHRADRIDKSSSNCTGNLPFLSSVSSSEVPCCHISCGVCLMMISVAPELTPVFRKGALDVEREPSLTEDHSGLIPHPPKPVI